VAERQAARGGTTVARDVAQDTGDSTPTVVKPPTQECSFTADTPVLLADGSTRTMRQVGVGMVVASTDPATGVSSSQSVSAVWPHVDLVWDVMLSDGMVVHTTANHPWWDASRRAWLRTDHLPDGDEVLTADGSTLTITDVHPTGGTQATYNLTVTGSHTHYVGDDQVLVHNCVIGESTAGKAGEVSTNPLENTQYTPRVDKQATSVDDTYHVFPSLDDTLAQECDATIIVGGDGVTRTLVQIPGSVDGETGVYEYIINSDSKVNYRLFVPTGDS
jgi:hypothetical protein